MSAIAGAVYRRDADRVVRRMLRAQTHRGPDGSSHVPFVDGAFGHAALHTTPESLTEPQPFAHNESGCVITADIRLDNRAELLALLNVSGSHVGDAELALSAYLRWGLESPTRLLGSFAFAIWDPRVRRLVLCRDQLSTRPIYYSRSGDGIVFASTVEAVTEGSNHQHPIDIDKARHFLVPAMESADRERTIRENVRSVAAATILSWNHELGRSEKRYWTLEPPAKLVLKSDAEYAEAFGELLHRVVDCRLRSASQPSVMLSGGIDSTSIVAAALRNHEQSNLVAYCGIEEVPGTASDTPYIRQLVDHLDMETVAISDKRVAREFSYDGITAVADNLFDASMVLFHSVAADMSERGTNVLLTGVGPDTSLTISPRSQILADLGEQNITGAWSGLRREPGILRNTAHLLRGAAARTMPDRLKAQYRQRRVTRGFETMLTTVGIDPRSPAGMRIVACGQADSAAHDWNTGNQRVDSLRRPFDAAALERYDRTFAHQGVEVRNPFMDRRFLTFCLSLPAAQICRNGWQKWILRSYLEGSVPPSVAWRTKSHVALSRFMAAVLEDSADVLDSHELDRALEPIYGPRICSQSRVELRWESWQRHVLSHFWMRHGS